MGRCSFDTLLLEGSRLEFVECNGRWGGTSTPMTLMNRLFGDWTRRPYATRVCRASGLERVRFDRLLEFFADDLYDVRTGCGRLIFFNPGRLEANSGIDVIALDETWEQASDTVRVELQDRLSELGRS